MGCETVEDKYGSVIGAYVNVTIKQVIIVELFIPEGLTDTKT